jgi:hypothetical protein
MVGTSKWAWLVSGELLVAGSGGGDDVNPDPGTEAPDAGTPDEADGAGNESEVVTADDSAAANETVVSGGTDDDAAGSDAGLGPELEPVATFAGPSSFTPAG